MDKPKAQCLRCERLAKVNFPTEDHCCPGCGSCDINDDEIGHSECGYCALNWHSCPKQEGRVILPKTPVFACTVCGFRLKKSAQGKK